MANRLFLIFFTIACIFINQLNCQSIHSHTAYPTVTVRGFLNFRTTVDNTVIVFTPSSNPTEQTVNTQTTTKPPSIQPTKTIDRTFPSNTINNLHHHQPADKFDNQIQSTQNYPTGLVTILGNTIVNQGLTTELETKVYGTYINGKYAQILKSSSKINEPIVFSSPVYINPTKSFNNQIKSTNLNQDFKQFINSRNELIKPKRGDNNIQSNIDQTLSASNLDKDELDKNSNSNIIKRNRLNRFGNGGRFIYQPRQQAKVRLNRFKAKPQTTITQKMKEEEEQAKRINQRFHKRLGLNKPTSLNNQQSNNKNDLNTNLQETHSSNSEQQHKRHVFDLNDEFDQEFKLNKQQQLNNNAFDNFDQSQLIKPSFSSAYIANDLASDDSKDEFKLENSKIVFSSINPNQNDLFVGDDEVNNDNHINGTPPIVVTRTYSITESTQMTSVVPMFIGTNLINQTITESFIIRKFITAMKTLPPGDLITLETEDSSIAPKLNETYTFSNMHLLNEIKPTSSINLPIIETSNLPFKLIDLNNPLIVRAALGNPKLGAIYFGLQQLNQQATTYNYITKPTTALTSSTVYHTKKISFYDGRQTRTRYLTDPGVLVTSTITTLTTETIPVINSQIITQQSKLQDMFRNELLMQNTPMPNLLQTPLDTTKTTTITTDNKSNVTIDNLQTQATNNQNQDLKPESSSNNNNQINTSNNNNLPINNPPISQPIINQPIINQQQSQQQMPNLLQSSFNQQQQQQQPANLLQSNQNFNTANLPTFANLPNISPFLNSNSNLNEVANILSNLQKGNFNNQMNLQNNYLLPTRIGTTTYTTESMITKTSTKIYTLIYNGFSTKYRTVTSSSVFPTTITQTTTTIMTNTINPLDTFNSLFG